MSGVKRILPVWAPLLVTPVLYAEPPSETLIWNGWPDTAMANLYVLPRVRYKVGLLLLDEKPSPLNV